MGFRVLDAGFLTTVQDIGRRGYACYGFSPSGAMDQRALALANLLVGNSVNEAVLECHKEGPSLEFTSSGAFALTGAKVEATLNGEKIDSYRTYVCQTRDILKIESFQRGMYAYISFAGGIKVPLILGSFSTDLDNHIGGYLGRALAVNDVLASADVYLGQRELQVRHLEEEIPSSEEVLTLRVVPWPQDQYFTEEAYASFYSSEFQITEASGREEYGLAGPAIDHQGPDAIPMEGTLFGAIQVVPTGMPYVLLADRPAANRKKNIAVVIASDIPKLVQRMPGEKVRFQKIQVEEAQRILIDDFILLKDYEEILHRQSRLSGGIRHTAERIENLLK